MGSAVGVVVYVALALAVGAVARARGRSPAGWFLISLVFSPVIAVLLLAFAPAGNDAVKWFGTAVIVGCLVLVMMFVLALVLITQHGGA